MDGNPVRPVHESAQVREDDIATTLNFTVEEEEGGDYQPFRNGANRIFLRRCYLDLLELIPQNLSRNGMGITGTAGVGKSVFAWILITELAKQGFCVLATLKKLEKTIHVTWDKGTEKINVRFIKDKVNVERVSHDQICSYTEQTVVHILDGKDMSDKPKYRGHHSSVIVVSSVMDDHFVEQMKHASVEIYIPRLSEEEMKVMAKLASTIPGLNEREVRDRHYYVGGATRFLLANKPTYEKEKRKFVKKSFEAHEMLIEKRAVTGLETAESQYVCQVAVETKRPNENVLDNYAYGVPQLASGLVIRTMLQILNRGRRRLAESLISFDTSARGHMFEHFAACQVLEGLTMTINNGRRITIPGKKESYLSTGEIQRHVVQMDTLHHPYEPNCPVVDFWTIEAMFNATVAKQHSLSWHRVEFTGILDNIRKARKASPKIPTHVQNHVPLIFLVPEGAIESLRLERSGLQKKPDDVDVYIVAVPNVSDHIVEGFRKLLEDENELLEKAYPPSDLHILGHGSIGRVVEPVYGEGRSANADPPSDLPILGHGSIGRVVEPVHGERRSARVQNQQQQT